MGGPKAQAECREFNGFGPKNIFAVAEAALGPPPWNFRLVDVPKAIKQSGPGNPLLPKQQARIGTTRARPLFLTSGALFGKYRWPGGALSTESQRRK